MIRNFENNESNIKSTFLFTFGSYSLSSGFASSISISWYRTGSFSIGATIKHKKVNNENKLKQIKIYYIKANNLQIKLYRKNKKYVLPLFGSTNGTSGSTRGVCL